MMQEVLLVTILIAAIIIIGLLGYIVGKITHSPVNNVQSFFKKNSSVESNSMGRYNIAIDEKKVVTNINTDGLEKKYESLGERKNSSENISDSINKLKTLKG